MSYIIPIIIISILIYAIFKRVDVFDAFTEGATEGISVAIKILPVLIFVITVITVFRASGAVDLITKAVLPLTNLIKLPPQLFPLMLLRSVSGSASIAMLSDIITKYGADSYIGRVASTMTSSTETTLYAVSIYSKGAGLKKTGPVVPIGIITDMFSAVCSVFIVNWFF